MCVKNQSWKKAWKDGPARHSGFSQAFSPLPKTFSRQEVMLAFLAGPVDTHTHTHRWKNAQGSKPTITSTPMCVLYVATYVQLRTQQCESMCVEFYATKQWGRTQLFTCYMSPAQRHLQLMGAITASRGLQKSESLRAGLRYCCCGLGDNYLMNKLPNPLAKHTSYST